MAIMPNPHGSDRSPAPGVSASVPEVSASWLAVFLEVARQGSFTAAASTLGYTQSAISRQVASLEAALGGDTLFDRLSRGVQLTEHGRVLLPHAEAVTERLRGARRELDALREVSGGRLRVGA
ncbi:LysR family transcriptional regulator, partial [Streptomyces sp. T-3]|nr:LysR family transcriptional regulator [Streptomyces sp. T-3]